MVLNGSAQRMRRPPDSVLDRNKAYQAIIDECRDQLTKVGYFNFDAVVKECGFEGMEVYWDYVRRKLTDPTNAAGVELLPVSSLFFKRVREKILTGDEITAADRRGDLGRSMTINSLLAGGGGKASGFVLTTVGDGKIAIAAMVQRKLCMDGSRQAVIEHGLRMVKELGDSPAAAAIAAIVPKTLD